MGVAVGQAAPTLGSRALAQLFPEVALIKTCGFELERTLQREIIERSIRTVLPAKVRVYVSDGNTRRARACWNRWR